MKKLILSFAIMFGTSVLLNTLNAQIEKGPKIEFSKEVHDYGNIKYGGEPNCTFEFKNTGNEPLIITNAKGSCGCTVPDWPKGPINKSVTISTNVTTGKDDQGNPSYYDAVIRIKGEVGPAPESGTPVNNTGAPTNN